MVSLRARPKIHELILNALKSPLVADSAVSQAIKKVMKARIAKVDKLAGGAPSVNTDGPVNVSVEVASFAINVSRLTSSILGELLGALNAFGDHVSAGHLGVIRGVWLVS
jgi:hypothetical protein